MEFSELSSKIHKISPSAIKMMYDSKYTVCVEIDLIYSDIKLAENGVFGQMGFRPNGGGSENTRVFGQN
jgi:hypothetical protein